MREKKFQLLKNSTPPPPPPPSPQNTHLNPGAIISTPNNSCVRYGLQPPTHLINRHCQQCLYTSSSLSINVHTISNPQYNDISCMMTRSPSPHKMSSVLELYNHGLHITTASSHIYMHTTCVYKLVIALTQDKNNVGDV